MNGLGQSCAAVGRVLGPIMGAPLLAWSENSGNLRWDMSDPTNKPL